MALNRERRRRLQQSGGQSPEMSRTGGSSSPAGSGQETYLIETEDGYMVRVPADKLESWQRAQKEHGSDPLTPEEQQLVERLWQRVYGQKE